MNRPEASLRPRTVATSGRRGWLSGADRKEKALFGARSMPHYKKHARVGASSWSRSRTLGLCLPRTIFADRAGSETGLLLDKRAVIETAILKCTTVLTVVCSRFDARKGSRKRAGSAETGIHPIGTTGRATSGPPSNQTRREPRATRLSSKQTAVRLWCSVRQP